MALSRLKWSLNRLEAENRESRRAGALPIFSGVCPQLNFAAMQFWESNPMSSWRSTAALCEQGYQIGTPCITWKLRFYTMLHSWTIRGIFAFRYSHPRTFPSPMGVTRKISIPTLYQTHLVWKDYRATQMRCHTCVSLLRFSLLHWILWYPRYWKLSTKKFWKKSLRNIIVYIDKKLCLIKTFLGLWNVDTYLMIKRARTLNFCR
jgi:hypothetical protein